jgi:hypothetical protein
LDNFNQSFIQIRQPPPVQLFDDEPNFYARVPQISLNCEFRLASGMLNDVSVLKSCTQFIKGDLKTRPEYSPTPELHLRSLLIYHSRPLSNEKYFVVLTVLFS